jgi:hypothetical protein
MNDTEKQRSIYDKEQKPLISNREMEEIEKRGKEKLQWLMMIE